jgi:choline dehydrogenase-like flavoprotein
VDRLTGRAEEARARSVVLCASTIETLRILLNSRSAAHPQGIGNRGGRLGRGLMDHPMIAVAGPGPESGEGSDRAGDPYDLGQATGFLIPRFRNLGGASGEAFRRGYMVQGGIGRGPGWYMLAHGEMLARPSNRVTLDPTVRDAWGIPAARIDVTPSENEAAMIADAAAMLHAIAAATSLRVRSPAAGRLVERLAFGLWKGRLLDADGAFLPGSAVHEIGGAAMGASADGSVTNRWGQIWDVPNVVVADGACFPSGCCQNVTLTIMALAARASEHLSAELVS